MSFLNDIASRLQPFLDMVKTQNPKDVLPRDYRKERIFISKLIFDILAKNLLVREALLKFPKDLKDPSSIAAYHALIHLEADEELRENDTLYKEEQDNYIIFIAETFKNGEELPQNMIKEYENFYQWAPSQFSNTKKGIWDKLKRQINI